MVYRIYVEKKPGFDGEAQGLKHELVELVGIKGLKALRLLNRYDVEGIDRDLFEKAIPTVFSEPPVDVTYTSCPPPRRCLLWSICPASLTSVQILLPSVSSC